MAIGGAYSRLFRFKTGTDPQESTNHDLENDVGISAESPDAVTWTVKLRNDAKFFNIAPVNGHPVEAEDIKAIYLRALDPATSNPNRGSLGMIDPNQIQTPDKQTVTFKLTFPYAPFRTILASPTYSMLFPREVLSGGYDPSKTIIGSGPFIGDALTPNVAYTFRKNPDWFEKGMPYVDNLRLAIISDAAQQLAQFSAGNLDELTVDNPSDANTAQQRQPKAQLLEVQNPSSLPIYFQLGDPSSPFQDIRLRRAVSMALDRDTLGKAVFQGKYAALVFVPLTVGKWALRVSDLPQDTQQYYTYNPGEAKKLVDAAGVANQQFRLAYIINGPSSFAPTPAYKLQTETIGNMLSAIGLKVSLISYDYNKDFVNSGHGTRQGFFDKDIMMFAGAGAARMRTRSYSGIFTRRAPRIRNVSVIRPTTRWWIRNGHWSTTTSG